MDRTIDDIFIMIYCEGVKKCGTQFRRAKMSGVSLHIGQSRFSYVLQGTLEHLPLDLAKDSTRAAGLR